MTHRLFLCLLSLLLGCPSLIGQTLFGTVQDGKTSEGLIGAYLTDTDRNSTTTTDAFGNFKLTIPAGATAQLSVSYLGYRTLDTTVTVTSQPLRLRLVPQADLPTVVVSSIDDEKQVRSNLSVVDVPIQLLNAIPPLAGETDPLKALQLMPGIAAGAEGTADLYVRGGTPDQNLILFDGANVYNANHLFGFVSPFHPDLLKSIRVHKAGFPARFGGRLSSVVEVNAEEGNKQEWKSSLGLGLVNSRFRVTGPLKKDRLSLVLGGRTAHLSLLNLLTSNQESFQTYLFYDFNVKLNLKTDRSNLSLSFFRNYDRTAAENRFLRTPLRGVFDYGNLTGSARWSYALSPTFSSVVLLTSNDYRYRAREELSISDDEVATTSSVSTIAERTAKLEIQGNLGASFSTEFGLEANNRLIRPRRLSATNELFPTVSSPAEYSNDFAVYQAGTLQLGRRTVLEAGLRLQAYDLPFGGGLVSFLEPRFNGRQQLSTRSSVTLSYAKMSQGLHMISNNFIGLPTNLWVTANARTPPASSHNYSLGYAYNDQNGTEVAVDAYYKTAHDIIDPLPGVSFFQSSAVNWEEDVSRGGESRAYGLEMLYRRSGEKFFGWVAYTLSWNRVRYADINGGEWYYRQFDRRHDLSVVGGINLPSNWQFLSTFVLNSGFRLTLPVAIYYDGFSNRTIPVYRGRYNERSPIYHRLDISFQHRVVKRSGKFRTFTVGCNNVYARRNPTYLITETDVSYATSGTLALLPDEIRNTVRQFSFFTFIPFVSYAFSL